LDNLPLSSSSSESRGEDGEEEDKGKAD